MNSVANGVVHSNFHHIVVKTAVGIAQILIKNALSIVCTVVYGNSRSRTNCCGNSVAQGVVHRKHDNEVSETAVGTPQTLCVNARQAVWAIVLAVHRSASHVAVGVESGSGTYHRTYGVAQGVVHRKHQHYNAVAAVHRKVMLRELARHGVRTVANGVYGPGTHGVVQRVAESVVHHKTDHQVVQAMRRRINKVLGVNALLGVGRIVAPTYGNKSQMAVGVESLTGTESVVHSVANSVVYIYVVNNGAVAAVTGMVPVGHLVPAGVENIRVVSYIHGLTGAHAIHHRHPESVPNDDFLSHHTVASVDGFEQAAVFVPRNSYRVIAIYHIMPPTNVCVGQFYVERVVKLQIKHRLVPAAVAIVLPLVMVFAAFTKSLPFVCKAVAFACKIMYRVPRKGVEMHNKKRHAVGIRPAAAAIVINNAERCVGIERHGLVITKILIPNQQWTRCA